MKIQKQEVKTFRTIILCDCGKEMKPTNYVLASYPPIYTYKCEECGETHQSKEEYPHVTYEII